MNLPITVNLSIETNKTSFEITPQSIPTYNLSLDEPITVQLQVDKSKRVYALALESNLHEVALSNDTVINATIIDIPHYEGSYVVDPSAHNSIILETRDKLCTDDITVNKIQTARTSNPYGDTFYIAEVS